MAGTGRATAVPAEALIYPTLMLTGVSAATVYQHPAGELRRLMKAGAILRLAHGYYCAVPVEFRDQDWSPSLESTVAGLAIAIYGPGAGIVCGLSAARVHTAIPRAIGVGHACGPRQHAAVTLTGQFGTVHFHKRDPQNLDIELWSTDVGPGHVTTVEQTILDLSTKAFGNPKDQRADAVLNLMERADHARLEEIAELHRGRTALTRARELYDHA